MKEKYGSQGVGRPGKRNKTTESDEEEVYFDKDKFEKFPNQQEILLEASIWRLTSHQERGLRGMTDGFEEFETEELNDVLCIKGEWKIRGQPYTA